MRGEDISTDAVRDHIELARYDLIPMDVLEALGTIYAEGSVRYGDYNWQKGFKWSDVYNHAIKHLQRWRDGDNSEDNLSKVIWGFVTLKWYEIHNGGEDDLRK